jgi:hypothetical protein
LRLKNGNQLLIAIFIHRFLNMIGFPKLIWMLQLFSGSGEISGLELLVQPSQAMSLGTSESAHPPSVTTLSAALNVAIEILVGT